jgi:hypothetical protein
MAAVFVFVLGLSGQIKAVSLLPADLDGGSSRWLTCTDRGDKTGGATMLRMSSTDVVRHIDPDTQPSCCPQPIEVKRARSPQSAVVLRPPE